MNIFQNSIHKLDWRSGFIALIVALLLVNPLALGPSTAIWPNLFGLLAAGLCLCIAAFSHSALSFRHASSAGIWLLSLACYVVVHSLFLQNFSTHNTVFVFTAFGMLATGAALQLLPTSLVAPALAWGVLIAALLNALMGWLQFVKVSDQFSPLVNQVSSAGQVYGNLRQPNQFASLMAMGLASLWWTSSKSLSGIASSVSPFEQSTSKRLLTMLSAIFLVSGIVLCGSRTGVLELCLISFAAFLWRGRFSACERWLQYFFIALPLIYFLEWALLRGATQLFDIAVSPSLERFSDASGSGRNLLYRNVIVLIQQSPLLGYGVHELNFQHFMTDFSKHDGWLHQGRFPALLDNAHNVVLHSWVELGLIGMLLSVGALAYGTLKSKPWRERRIDQQMAWLMLGILTLHSMLEYPLHYAQFWLPFCLALAVAFTKDTGVDILQVGANSARMQMYADNSIYLSYVLSGVCILFFAYAAWDYDRVSQAYNGPHRRPVPAGVDRIAEAQKSWLFAPYARFAKLMTTTVTADYAKALLPDLRALMHFSAEPRVLDKLLQALRILESQDPTLQTEIKKLEAQYAQAFPEDYARYRASVITSN